MIGPCKTMQISKFSLDFLDVRSYTQVRQVMQNHFSKSKKKHRCLASKCSKWNTKNANEHPRINCNISKSPKMSSQERTKSAKRHPKDIPKSIKSHPKISHKSAQSRPKVKSKSGRSQLQVKPKSVKSPAPVRFRLARLGPANARGLNPTTQHNGHVLLRPPLD